MTYLVVIPAATQIAGDDPIEQHRLLAQLDRQIVRTYPSRYARWWLLAIRRGIWGSLANIVMHPIFLVVILLVASIAVVLCVWPQHYLNPPVFEKTDGSAPARHAITLIAISYAAFGLGFVSLTSPTIGRFSDAAFVFIPSLAVIAIARKSQ